MRLVYSPEDFVLLNHDCQKARNTIEYSLLFPEISSLADNPESWVERALLNCYSICHPRLFYVQNYQFFGLLNYESAHKSNLYCLSDRMAYPTDGKPFDNLDFTKKDFFVNTILSQCIMSAYDTVMQALLYNKTVKSYTFINKCFPFNTKKELKSLRLFLPDNFCKDINSEKNDLSSIASGFNRKLTCHKKILYQTPLFDFFSAENGDIPLYQSDIVHQLNKIDSRKLKNYLQLFDNTQVNTKSKSNNWANFMDFHKALTYSLPIDSVDRLYYLYRIEQLFALGLGDCVIRNICQLKRGNKLYPDGLNDFRRLAAICKLPNVFSRNIYLQYAFDSMECTYNPLDNFFANLQKPENGMKFFEDRSFYFHEWQDNFVDFCNFFSNLVFPVFEWHFLLTLFKTTDTHMYTKGTTAFEKLHIIQKLLANYISENWENIINPFWGKKYNDRLIFDFIYCSDFKPSSVAPSKHPCRF